ncbi:MAG: DUF2312 domain-containing protein, partial [Methylocystaceae bacterium]|nr:DUF2312 domain-containing protein [Methylocystaceae bacterium]
MAKIVLGMAAPHSGMLGKPGETWLEDGERDRKNTMLWYRKKHWSFADLAQARKDEGLTKYLTLEERIARHAACRKAIEVMRQVYVDAKVDLAIIIGKDQKEIFLEAKSAGYDGTALRALIRERAEDQTKRQTREALLDVYRR